MVYIKTTPELYHHGILGQKWGVRNGPPYPLKPGEHSTAEKKAGYQKSISGSKRRVDPDKVALGILIGVGAAAATALTAYTVYSLVEGDHTNFGRKQAEDTFNKLGPKLVTDVININTDKPKNTAASTPFEKGESISSHVVAGADVNDIAQKIGAKVKDSPTSQMADILAVNPDYDITDPLTNENCGYCSAAYIMRRMGMDVTAVKNDNGLTVAAWDQMFKGSFDAPNTIFYNERLSFALEATSRDLKNNHKDFLTGEAFNLVDRPGVRKERTSAKSFTENVHESIKNALGGDDSGIGIISVQTVDGGHVFNWEKLPGKKVQIIDAQTGQTDKDALHGWDFLWSLNKVGTCYVGRVDNARSIDTDLLKTFVPNDKSGGHTPKVAKTAASAVTNSISSTANGLFNRSKDQEGAMDRVLRDVGPKKSSQTSSYDQNYLDSLLGDLNKSLLDKNKKLLK